MDILTQYDQDGNENNQEQETQTENVVTETNQDKETPNEDTKEEIENVSSQKDKSIITYQDYITQLNSHYGNKLDFVEQLGVMVINDIVRKNASFIEKTIAFFSALRPVLSMDPLTGEPSVSITIEPSQEEMTMRSIFNYLNESGREIYIAIDEFQQIAEYPEKGTEALLRSYIQFAQHVHCRRAFIRHRISY